MNIVSLFDLTGHAVRPWAEAGFKCYCFDLQHEVVKIDGNITFVPWNADHRMAVSRVRSMVDGIAWMVMSFAPCDDLAGCGAKHWQRKAAADPDFQRRALRRFRMVERVAEHLLTDRWVAENPSGAISRLWRRPDYSFHPAQYGGYIPVRDAEHPEHPEYIPPRDAYNKRTCLWTGKGYQMAPFRPVEPEKFISAVNGKTFNRQTQKLGGRSLKTKNIRSATPRGWAIANFRANRPK